MIEVLFKLSPEGWFAVALMVIISVWFILEIRRASNNLTNEHSLLERLRPLAVLPSEDELLDEGALDLFDSALKNASRSSLVHRVVRAVLNARVINNPDVEAIISLLLARESVQLGAVRGVPNLLMLAGLLGTVFGLAGAVGGLSSQIAQSVKEGNIDALSSALVKTLGQMQGAFGATLWGVLLSGVSAVWLGNISSARAKFAAELQDFVLIDLVPAVFPRSSAQQLEEQRKIAKRSQQSIQQLKDVLDKSVTGFQEVLGKTSERVQQSLVELGNATEKANTAFGQVMNGVTELKTALSESATNLANSQTNSSKVFSIASEDLKQQLSEQANRIGEFQTTFSGGSNKILEGIHRVSDSLDQTVKIFREQGAAQLNSGTQMLNHLDVRFERLEKVLGGVTDLKTTLEKGFENVVTAQTRVSEVFSNDTKNLKRQFVDQTRLINEVQKTLLESQNKILEGVGNEPMIMDQTMKNSVEHNILDLNVADLGVNFEQPEEMPSELSENKG